jgi:hypothetical protein
MEIIIDNDVKAVLEFMQRNFVAARLISIAAGVNDVAPILWNRHARESIDTLSLVAAGLTSPVGDKQ